ncbi:MAG: hypothetical protein NTV52_21585 [Acidobacteria bacterium]|nr:hypothetical protein [Acidobacteriota bacterium]
MTDNEIQFRRYVAGFLSVHHICLDCEQKGFINLANKCHLMRPRTHATEKLTLDYCTPLCTGCYRKRSRMGQQNEVECVEMGHY